MNYCFTGKQPELPAELLPNFPDKASISASISTLRSKLPRKISSVAPVAVSGALPVAVPEETQPPASPPGPNQIEVIKQGCERHYKFVENILRRIAANLGNSPSQTDVKIVSCIPIDVTDLQQRIFNLEKELEEAKMSRKTDYAASVRQEIVGATASNCGPCISFERNYRQCKCHPSHRHVNLSQNNSSVEAFPRRKRSDRVMTERKSEKSKLSKKSLKQRFRSRPKDVDPYVYYVQANTSPFGKLQSSTKKYRAMAQIPTKPDVRQQDSVARMVDSLQLKYTSQLLADFSSSSEYSAPVCRDAAGAAPPEEHEPDVFSGRGKFHNLDNDIKNLCNDAASSCSKYYDDSLYDLVPVKEKSKDVKKSVSGRKRKEHIDSIGKSVIHKNIPEETNFVMNCTFDNQGFPTYNNFRKIEGSEYAKSSKSYKKDIRKRKGTDYNDALLRKNASCLTIKMTNMECQTTSEENAKLNATPKISDNAENTLNEIKETLQTVLETVKTSSRVKHNTEKVNSAIKNQIDAANSDIMRQSLKLKPPHPSGPIQLFYTPVPFINTSYLNPCMHLSSNYHSEKNDSKQKEDKKVQDKVTEIWKPETAGEKANFTSTSEHDEPTPNNKKERILYDTQPVPENITETVEIADTTPQINSKSLRSKNLEDESNESIVTDEDKLSLVEENKTEVEKSSESGVEAEDEEEDNESEYAYRDTSGDGSVIHNAEAVTENADENQSIYSSESTETTKSIEQPVKEKKLDKMFNKVVNFFKTKPSKTDRFSTKKEKRKQANKKSKSHVDTAEVTMDNEHSLQSSDTDEQHEEKTLSSSESHSLRVLHMR